MVPRARSALVAAGVCVALVLTLLLVAPHPDALRERLKRLASLTQGPEDAAERANADAPDPLDPDADPDPDAPLGDGDGDGAPFGDSDFYGGFPMFGDMMDVWLRDNLSRLLKDGERRFGRRELAENGPLLSGEKDKT